MTHAPYTPILEDEKGFCEGHYEQLRNREDLLVRPFTDDKVLYLHAVHCLDFWLKSYFGKAAEAAVFQ